MLKKNNQKTKNSRVFVLLKYLYENTDLEHKATTAQLLEYLKSQGIVIDRHTLATDLELLEENGFEVEKDAQRGASNQYFIENRRFSLPELKLLLDAVSTAKFISGKKSEELIRKLSDCTSRHYQGKLVRHLYTPPSSKYDVKQIYYIIDQIIDAINRHKKIGFPYFDFDADKNHVARRDGELYINSPYYLVWDDSFYYLVGYSEEKEKMVHMRLDRMGVPKILEEDAVNIPEGFRIEEYATGIFGMYDGRKEEIVLECDEDMMKYVIDQFGIDVMTWRVAEDRFRVKADVHVSPPFFGWVFQFGGKIKILKPESVVEKYRRMVSDVL